MSKKSVHEQMQADNMALAFAGLMGADIVRKSDHEKVINENRRLLQEAKNLEIVKKEFASTYCLMLGYKGYHKKWKPITRKYIRKYNKLNKEGLYRDFQDYPEDIAANLKEAYNCYLNGLDMACYIMILRTIEIAVSIIFDFHNEPTVINGRKKFIPAKQKLDWVSDQKLIGGIDYTFAKSFIEERNNSIHSIYVPTERKIMSAFETVIELVDKLKGHYKKT